MEIDNTLIAHYESLIKKHLDIAKFYEESLRDLHAKFKEPKSPTQSKGIVKDKIDFSKSTLAKGANHSFGTNVSSLINKAQRPLTAKELREIYNSDFKASFTKDAFSPRLSSATKIHIKKHVEPNNPIEIRTFYGVPGWFNGEVLKEEYKEKIQKVVHQERLL